MQNYPVCKELNAYIWAKAREITPSDMYIQWRLKSAFAFVISLYCTHEETLHPRLSKICQVKVLIRLHECVGQSESSLCTLVQRYIFWHCDLFSSCYYIYSKYLHNIVAHYFTCPKRWTSSQTSMTPTSLGPWKFVWDIGSLSHWRLTLVLLNKLRCHAHF